MVRSVGYSDVILLDLKCLRDELPVPLTLRGKRCERQGGRSVSPADLALSCATGYAVPAGRQRPYSGEELARGTQRLDGTSQRGKHGISGSFTGKLATAIDFDYRPGSRS